MNYKKFFPIFQNLPDLVYLDSAASAQKPKVVVDRISEFYEYEYANIHRGVYGLSENATRCFENTRDVVAKFLNVEDRDQIVFTKNATEAINLVAYSFGEELPPNSTILITEMEHHANFVPWVELARRKNFKLKVVPLNNMGYITADDVMDCIDDSVFMVAVTQLSNVLGVRVDVKRIIEKAKDHGARVLIDGSQSVCHMKIDLAELDPDFFVFSGHKLYGPSGVGVLYIKKEVATGMKPFLTGGDMVLKVSENGILFQDVPHKFEAGTPDIASVIGLGTAIRFLSEIGMVNIEQNDIEKINYALNLLKQLDFVELVIDVLPGICLSSVAFNVKGVHPHDVAQVLGDMNICVRAGHHCAQPLHSALKLEASVRMSLGIYNDFSDIDKLVEGLKIVSQKFC